jgi:hypothetical protein
MSKQKLSYLENIQAKKTANLKLISKYETIGNKRQAEKIDLCFNSFYTELYKHKTQELEKTKSNVFFTCKNKFCNLCCFIKSKKTFVKTFTALEEMKKDNINFLGYHLTLTVKNPKVEDLTKTLTILNKAFHTFIQKMPELEKYLVGFQVGREVSQSAEAKQAGEIHPHLHVLLLLDPSFYNPETRHRKITQKEFREYWKKCCQYYNIEAWQIDFKPIKSRIDYSDLEEEKELDPFICAISEVAKYPAKPDDIQEMSDRDFRILHKSLFRKRMISTGGKLKEYLKKTKDEEILHIQNFELMEILFCQFNNFNKLQTKKLDEIEKLEYLKHQENIKSLKHT